MSYKKRKGASGISGQLYETNLISLILFKLHRDQDVADFSLASNMDNIGAFDDICLKLKLTDHDRPIFAFIQAKHKENDDTFLNYELIKNFYNSYFIVKKNFCANNDIFFKEKFVKTDTVFILYTNAKYCDDTVNLGAKQCTNPNPSQGKQARIPYESDFAKKINDLIATGEQGSQVNCNAEVLNLAHNIVLENEIIMISEHFAKFLNVNGDQSIKNTIMLNDYMLQYHVILAKTILNISKVKSDKVKSLQWRELTFNSDFFSSNDEIIKMFRKYIFSQVFKIQVIAQVSKKKEKISKQKVKSEDAVQTDNAPNSDSNKLLVDNLISTFLSNPSARNLSPLIGIYINYVHKSNKLEFTSERSNSDTQKLDKITLMPADIQKAEDIAAEKVLKKLTLKVPVTFGNLDLTIGGDDKKIEKRLFTLTEFFDNVCKSSKLIDTHETVVIDDTIGKGYLSGTGSISGAIGNLLVYDEATKLLKFTEDPASLPYNAQILFASLSSIMNNLHVYRFDVKPSVQFPKLVFDFTDETKQILKNMVIYDRQSNSKKVAKKLQNEIEENEIDVREIHIPSRTKCIHYHHEIQKWWMTLTNGKGTYLTKGTDETYQQAIEAIVTEPQISAMQTTFYRSYLTYFSYSFNDMAMDSLKMIKNNALSIITADLPTLTTVKVIQCLRDKYKKSNIVLDLEYIVNLKDTAFDALHSEIKYTNKALIVVCDKINNIRTLHKRLDQISMVTKSKKIIIVTNKELIGIVKQYFTFSGDDVINDDDQSLVSLTEESKKNIIENAEIILQGEKIGLNLAVDCSVKFIKGVVFGKIIHNESIIAGKSPSSLKHIDIMPFYVAKKVIDAPNKIDEIEDEKIQELRSFDDINDDSVLITAKPGMGMSTLLTYLQLNTKEHDMKKQHGSVRWIERINLADHTKVFEKWQENNTEIGTLETLKFICQIILKNSLLNHSEVFYNWHQKEKDLENFKILQTIYEAMLKYNNIPINLEENHDKVYLKQCTGDECATFELNMFLHFYNERRLIFTFDGFDQICPQYADIVIKLFHAVINLPQKAKIWVTSRTDYVLPDLERAFCNSHEIQYYSSPSKYKKRPGTSGIGGQLYDTITITLLLFKLQHDLNVQQFQIAADMDNIGKFDDISLKIKPYNGERSMYAFINILYREKTLTGLNVSKSIIKDIWLSYFKVKRNFYENRSSFFEENIDNVDWALVIYTNAKYVEDPFNNHPRIPFIGNFADKLNNLICTGRKGSQLSYNNEYLEFVKDIIVEYEIDTISKHFAKFFKDLSHQSMNILLDDYMVQYHVILAKTIVNISEVNIDENKSLQWRELTFNSDFFSSDDKIIKMFRKYIFAQVLKTQVNKKNDMISTFLSDPSELTLNPLIEIPKSTCAKPSCDVQKDQIVLLPATIQEAEVIAVGNVLKKLTLKVPVTFGNIDLCIRGNNVKIEKRLTYITLFFEKLCRSSNLIDTYEIAVLNDPAGANIIRSTIGNLLVYDKVTKLYKFTENPESLHFNARFIFDNLSTRIENLHLYRFDVKPSVNFPRLNFDFTEEVKYIFEKLVIYDEQGSYDDVQQQFIQTIQSQNLSHEYSDRPIKPETLSIFYQHEVQKWKMSGKTQQQFLIKTNQITYHRITRDIATEPQLCEMLRMFYRDSINYFRFLFNKDTIHTFILRPRTMLVTDIPILTTVKVIQCLNLKYKIETVAINLDYVSNIDDLNNKNFEQLKSEIENTNKLLIFVYAQDNYSRLLHKRLDQISKIIESRRIIVVTNYEHIDIAKQYFPNLHTITNDDKYSFVNLAEESQKNVTNNSQVTFLGEKVGLGMLVDDISVEFIKGAVFIKIANNETITLGKSIKRSKNYEEINVLCNEIKELDPNKDIVKWIKVIRLTDFKETFDSWLSSKITLDTLETLKFLCQTILKNHMRVKKDQYNKQFEDTREIESLDKLRFVCQAYFDNNKRVIELKQNDDKVYLKQCTGDEWATFELNMFLHFYNERRLILIFENLHEMCPFYEDICMMLIHKVHNLPQRPFVRLTQMKAQVTEQSIG